MNASRLIRTVWRIASGLALVVLTALVLVMAATALPRVAGFTPYVVLSGSMEPALSPGDVAVVRRADPSGLRAGDVITYKTAAGMVTHRIMGIELSNQGNFFLTQGDANRTGDRARVSAENIVGRMRYSIPLAGYFIVFANSLLGMGLFIALPTALLGAVMYREHRAKSRTKVLPEAASSSKAA